MDSRPRLRAGRRPLRRTAGSLQFGLTAGQALILSGLRGAEAGLVEALDGRHTLPELYAVAACHGVDAGRVDTILQLLRAEGLLAAPAGQPAVRLAASCVVVGGWGPVPDSIAATLRAAGVGRVDTGRWALDHAELDLPHRGRPGPLSARPDLVVLTAQEALDASSSWPWRRHAVAVLAFVASETSIAIGPLVTPDPADPCLHCLELHRSDRDEHWPHLLAQVRPGDQVLQPVRSEPTLTAAAAGVAAMIAVGHLNAEPLPPGLTVELSTPFPRLDHRIWARHPHCGEHAALRSAPAG